MTVQYGEDTSTTSGYGDTTNSNLHPALQKHLDTVNQIQPNQITTQYNAQPFSQGTPAPQAAQGPSSDNMSQPSNPNPSAPASNETTNSMQGGQIPTATAMAGASAGGGSDTANAPTAGSQPKPANMQLQGAPTAPPPTVDTTDPDNIGSQADANQASIIQGMRAQQAGQVGSMPSGSMGPGNANLMLNQGNVSVPGFDGEQIGNAKAIIQQGLARGMSRQDITAAVMAGLTESSLRNLSGGDRDSAGLFQMRPSQGWGSYQQVTDPNYEIAKFYDMENGLGGRTSMSPWAEDQAIERSAFSDGSNYYNNYGNAQRLVEALTQEQPQGYASSPTMKANGSLSWISQNTNKYLDYDGWYGAQCVDLYDFYTTGFVGGRPIPVGYAQEIWTNHDASVYTQIDRGQSAHMGDVAVWGNGPYTPMSHVAIVIGDNGDGTLKTLSNNATAAGSSGNSAIVNISKAALLGYLRPNKLMGV